MTPTERRAQTHLVRAMEWAEAARAALNRGDLDAAMAANAEARLAHAEACDLMAAALGAGRVLAMRREG